jgi:hypothetical protein
MQETMRDLHHAVTHIPKSERAAQAKPSQERLQTRERGKSGPQPLRELVAIVLARVGVSVIPSNPAGEKGLS